ncbi:MAG TPA: cupredoxin domain-containing protein [Solirubrobacterales bacterium]|jgi:plastocyanin|nr:cupredoxin domain-containing protein [Solirubrobacterales bacterium]
MLTIVSPRRRLSVTIVASLLAVACAAAAPAVSGAPERTPLKGGTAHVGIREFAFHPGKLTIGRGTKVVFANNDTTAHTATSGGNFATGRIRPGRTAAVKFEQSGTFPYHCSIHNFMHGKIVVR